MSGQLLSFPALQGGNIVAFVSMTGATALPRVIAMSGTSVPLPSTITILDEVFDVAIDDGDFLITHSRWSLLGRGHDLTAARQQLCEEARDLAPIVRKWNDENSTRSAIAMKKFVLALSGKKSR